MKIHHLQHVPFEGLGSMESHFQKKGYRLSATHLYRGNSLPAIADFDWLIVMGGPMGVNDEIQFPWLKEEKAFIRESIDGGKSLFCSKHWMLDWIMFRNWFLSLVFIDLNLFRASCFKIRI